MKEQTSFRDRPINMDESGKRKWVYARKPKGNWYKRRKIVAALLFAFLIFAPFIKINGHPLMLLDILHRKFVIFGVTVWAQDTFLAAMVMAVVVVSIVLFTTIFGRLWCGWACPQTLFLEMIFRQIEYFFDGDHRKGNPAELSKKRKLSQKIAKHSAFGIASVLIVNILLIWLISPKSWFKLISEPINQHIVGFTAMLVLSAIIYFIYSVFREQICTVVCPYGRLQGVLLDSKSISVIYDFKRGEPRGAKNTGDCIDCKSCIAVCPTGTDIRNGSQLECVACTACIDECNQVMEKLKRQRNLIRYDSFQGVETGKRNLFTARTYAYMAVLIILMVALAITIIKRTPVDATLIRIPGTSYQQPAKDTLSNLYNLTLINKTNRKKELSLKITSTIKGSLQLAGKNAEIEADSILRGVVIIKLPENELKSENTELQIGIFEGNEIQKSMKINFIGPEKK
jgi:cytochrome c oxidase accessory protein FixG